MSHEKFLERVKERAKENPQKIVFPEGFEERILRAVERLMVEKTAVPILLGNPDEIWAKVKELGLNIDKNKIEIHDPATSPLTKKYVQEFYALRKDKGATLEDAEKTMQGINYFGTMMVHMDDADGMVSGTTFPTADTVRPALQIVKTKGPFRKVSGFFFMIYENRVLLFADCAIMIDPNSHELADIAMDTAQTAKRFGLTPKIAMLSFSTAGSAHHPHVDKVREATKMVHYHMPEVLVEGEMQVDAALVPSVCEKKFPGSKLKGDANILIFPNLEAGNIAYKLVERLAGYNAIGPILQGLRKPINDLSRGCSFEDISNLAAITTIEAQELDYQMAVPETR